MEAVNTIQEQETPTPSEKKKTGAKARKMAGRLVPAALGKLNHPDCCYVHKVIWLVIGVLRVLHVRHHAMYKQVGAAMQC